MHKSPVCSLTSCDKYYQYLKVYKVHMLDRSNLCRVLGGLEAKGQAP